MTVGLDANCDRCAICERLIAVDTGTCPDGEGCNACVEPVDYSAEDGEE